MWFGSARLTSMRSLVIFPDDCQSQGSMSGKIDTISLPWSVTILCTFRQGYIVGMSYPLFQHCEYLIWTGVSLIPFVLNSFNGEKQNIRQQTQSLGLENNLCARHLVLQYLLVCLLRHTCQCICLSLCFTRYKLNCIVELRQELCPSGLSLIE